MHIKLLILYKKSSYIVTVSIVLFMLVDTVLTNDLSFEACVPATCGQVNISYPFWIPDHQESYCGHPRYEISCNDEYPIVAISGDEYIIQDIFYNNNSFHLANTKLYDSENTCPIPLHNFSLSNTPFSDSINYTDLYFLYNCSSYPSEPTYKIGCGHNSTDVSFAVFHFDHLEHQNYSISSCESWVNAPVGDEVIDALSDLNLTSLWRKGFVLEWDKDNCSLCRSSGGRCGYRNEEFVCFCSDGPHSPTCYDGLSVVGLLLSIFGAWFFNKVVKVEINKRRKGKFFKQNGGLLLQQLLSCNGNMKTTEVFKSCELEKATNHYSVDRVLGQGGQGTVYKGILSDGRHVAVKAAKIANKANVEQFINEVVILSHINHRNIVRVLGCCLETEVPMLVYEFISNGTLFQHIQNPHEKFPLTWERRLQIATEIAGSLSYLHNAASMPIYHRDIKSTNIMLDDNYKAKVCDFGMSRSVNAEKTHLTTQVKGTFGYLDPEYFWSGQFSEKSDVYSFGVVLAELITGWKPIFSNTSQEFKGLAPHFIESMEENRLLEMIDPRLSTDDNMDEMVEVAHLAKACLDSNGKRRPTIKEVAAQLERIRMSKNRIIPQQNEGIEHYGEGFDYIPPTRAWADSSTTSSNWELDS